MHTPVPGGLRAISYNVLNVKAPPETVPFLRLQLYQMVGNLRVEVYKRVKRPSN